MNSLTIIGNLTAAPELRVTSTGINVCSFTVAVNRRKTGDAEQETDFFRVTAWRQLGENCARFLDKGRKVCVVGEVTLHKWEKDGKTGANMEVTANNVEFLSPRVSDPETPQIPANNAVHNNPVPAGFAAVETDELPF